ncbi:DUF6479 family protein [Demequina mangrovi]|uniref:Uncharacterized protein n=1 Tax=Demequina mangrovi TaxID=1043493 RepID=A0A1H6X6G6_9MICO|nr:hypothetical protein [Demequina mangrovi]SEJ24668.1 hypothetical protein SAMN05421637_1309 [Demequina mangrovi]
MNTALIIGIVAGVVVLAVLVAVVAISLARRQPPAPREDPGRGPTGQHPDPVEGTPSDTSTPHWDRRIDPNEGPQ